MAHTHEIKVPEKSPRKVGVVESDARQKTRTVVITFSVRHPKYGKYLRKKTVLHVHDESNQSKKGDRVEIAECRPISKKPLETRMGTGKAETEYWAARIKPGTMLFEITGVSEEMAKQALSRVAHKMPVRCRFVGRRATV